MLLSLHFNNSLAQPFLVFLSIPLNDFFSSGKEDGSQKGATGKTLKSGVLQGGCANWSKSTLRSFLIVKWKKKKYF